MSLESISKILSIQSSMNNLKMQQTKMMSDQIAYRKAKRNEGETIRIEKEVQFYNDAKRSNNIITELNKQKHDQMSVEDRFAIDSAINFHRQRSSSTLLHLEDPVSAALSPPSGEAGVRSRDANTEYAVAIMDGAGFSVDQQEYFREMGVNNESLANGGDELEGLSYEGIEGISIGIIAKSVPGFEPSEVHTVPEDMEQRMVTFRSASIDNFRNNHENNADMTAQERMEAAVGDSLEEMNIDPAEGADLANAFLQSGMEGIMQYRDAENKANVQALEGLTAQNLIAARDGLNKLGYDAASLTPESLINALRENLGFRDTMGIAGAVNMQGEDTMLMSELAKKVKEINPLVDSDNITEFERKNLVKKNFLDVLGARISSSNVPPAERLAMMQMLDRIDQGVDNGQQEPMIESMLEHVYERFTEGYSTYRAEDGRIQNIAAQNGEGLYRETVTGDLVRTSVDFKRQAELSTGNDVAISSYYASQVEDISNGGGYSLVKAVALENGVMQINNSNKQFMLGTHGKGRINIGLSALADGIVSDKPLWDANNPSGSLSPAFANPQVREDAEKMMRNASLLSSIEGGKYLEGLFMKSDNNTNPIDKAEVVLEKFPNKEYLPESLITLFTEKLTPEMERLKTEALKSGMGSKGVVIALLHAQQTQAQGAANTFNNQLNNRAFEIYPDAKPNQYGTEQPLYNVAMTDEIDSLENDLPFVAGRDVLDDLDLGQKNDITKFRESLESRISHLKKTLKTANTTTNDDQKAMFDGTSASKMEVGYNASISVMEDLSSILKDLGSLPSTSTQYRSSAGFGVAGDISTEKTLQDKRGKAATQRREAFAEGVLSKRKSLSDRLLVVIDAMNKASL